LWTELKAIYPFVGGTANAHKFNLKNPTDNDAAFRMVFNGGVTHNANGVTFDGLTGYGDTKFAIEDFNSDTDLSYGFYNRTSYTQFISTGVGDMGVHDPGVATNSIFAFLRRFYPNDAGAQWSTLWVEGQPYGFIMGTIRAVGDSEAYRNGVSLISQATTNSRIPSINQSWFLGAVNNNFGTATDFTNFNYAFAFLGNKLSDAQSLSLYNRVQTFQTALGRQVV
jgi:hypothetical protein